MGGRTILVTASAANSDSRPVAARKARTTRPMEAAGFIRSFASRRLLDSQSGESDTASAGSSGQGPRRHFTAAFLEKTRRRLCLAPGCPLKAGPVSKVRTLEDSFTPIAMPAAEPTHGGAFASCFDFRQCGRA